VGEATTGAEAILKAKELQPDVVVIDIVGCSLCQQRVAWSVHISGLPPAEVQADDLRG
jgi:DNA-binding NarL/FixJ family response regulator